jgi:oxygen-independent coproporphyrinogen-3 oxidase
VSEALLMGLRLREGVDLARIARLAGARIDEVIDEGAVARLTGFIQRDGDRLCVTEQGMLLLDAILPQVVRDRVPA